MSGKGATIAAFVKDAPPGEVSYDTQTRSTVRADKNKALRSGDRCEQRGRDEPGEQQLNKSLCRYQSSDI